MWGGTYVYRAVIPVYRSEYGTRKLDEDPKKPDRCKVLVSRDVVWVPTTLSFL